MSVLKLEHVSKTFDEVEAVRDLSFSVEPGAMFGLLGPNGAGKTTTIRMIMRIIIQDSGQISLFDQPHAQELLNQVGYLPEERGLYRKMKIHQQLQFFGELKGMKAADARQASLEWLERFAMTDVREKKVEELSKGNQQKIQFIATIMHQPKLIILDEPFTGLDPVNVRLVKDIMQELQRAGCCIIFSTHQMEQVEKLCDSICLINKGQNVLEGRLRDIKKGFETDHVFLAFDGENGFLEHLDYVSRVEPVDEGVEIHLTEASKTQDLLKQAMTKLTIKRFEIREPSLEEIFIRTVQDTEETES